MNNTEKESDLDKRTKAFLSGLRALSLRTKIVIKGCGCCNSPYLEDVSNRDLFTLHNGGYAWLEQDKESDIKWVDMSEKYAWERYTNKIVK